jgi:hypothetical protein
MNVEYSDDILVNVESEHMHHPPLPWIAIPSRMLLANSILGD